MCNSTAFPDVTDSISTVDLKLIILPNFPRKAPLAFTTQEKNLEGHLEGTFFSKKKYHLTLTTSFENPN